MRITFFLIAMLMIVSTTLFGKDSKRIPNKEAKEWHDNLDNSPYKVYENFDDCVLTYDSIKSHITDKTHLKFIMGSSDDKGKEIDFRMFMIYIIGDEIEQGYVNDYKTIRYFDGKNWIPSSKDVLDQWTQNWEKYLANNKLPYTRAFLVPNEDVLTLNKGKIYLSFGLEKTTAQDSVKLLLCHTKYTPVDVNADTQLNYEEPMYMDACMPCPKVCGSDGL